ncbi:MAG: hypothetical protein GWN00_09475, partial [Aliifodinibius sp.]|nr:hypothetical protein [candidate division Zixibacteria bacterium]NIT56438.1 hypothetical protein [Fodinibius sp.]NIV11404.1 hypothetical protein [Fodinibius sp.]NIY25021.1 hypothetical protein [Fodinibius sp.]
MKKEFLLFMLALFFFTTTGIFSKGEKQQPTDPTKIIYDIAYMDTNNVDLPLVNNGSTANDGNAFYPNGTNLIFLFSGGLATTGFISGDFRASWMAPSSLIEEWQAGVWGMDPQDPLAKFYEVSADDGPGSPAYVEWADAVALGADFIDVNGDGLYDP